jgi:Carboxypeptidase regulatory-like domain
MYRCRVWLALLLCIFSFAHRASAQVAAGEITGIMRDQANAAVPGATVTVTNVETNQQRVVVSTGDGVYAAAGLPPGKYRVDVTLKGFRSVRRNGIRLATGETARIDFDLVVGDVREQVTVTADAPALRADTASLGTVVEQEQIARLPLNGRTFITLASLAPGVALPPTSQLPRINGGRPRTNEYLFDGISVLQPEPGQIAFFPVIDAIQEFKIESNSPPAEFGRFNGGVVNLTTRTGTNVLHGSGFEFLRKQALNARNVFQTANTVKPDYQRNQFGGTFGGPVARDRTFFFADYQGQRQSVGRTVISVVPTQLQRQGIFTEAIAGRVPVIYDPATTVGSTRTPFPGNAIPLNRADTVALSLLQRYPPPTSTGTANNYRRTENEVDNQDQWDVRIDHRFPSARNQVFGRLSYFRDGFVPVTPLPDGSGVTTGTLGPQNTTAWAFASRYQHTFAGRMLNEVRVGDTRRKVWANRRPARAGLFDRRHPAPVRVFGPVGPAGRRGPRPPAWRHRRRHRQRLVAVVAGHAAVGRPRGRHAADQLQRVRGVRRAAAESGRRSDVAGRPADGRAVVQHRRIRRHATVRDRHGVAQSRPRTVVPECGPRAHAADSRAHRPGARDPRGSVQPDEHRESWHAQRRPRRGQLRHDHDRLRSPGRPARAEVCILVLADGLRPSDSPTRSLARRLAGALRSRGSLAAARSRL